MPKKILIDAAHPEETRVVVADGNQTLDFDFESTDKQQITGNVYLAKVTRVEPSLQAAFLDYGGNRHGFLAFSEIHPDYYQIPKADKDALLEEQAKAEEKYAQEKNNGISSEEENDENINSLEGSINNIEPENQDENVTNNTLPSESSNDSLFEEELVPRKRVFQRKYKIQEVIKVRQILLIQVTKEERGNKGAALTSYISIAGRYCVLMPNTSRGGGISKKITNVKDRQKLKDIIDSLNVSKGSGLIVRTAGGKRTKLEIKRDYEFLLKTWESIRAQTMESIAPAMIHEEGNLIKRAIRDLYNRDINEIIVEGDTSFKEAKNYLKLLMPSHAKYVKKYEGKIPIFSFFEVENYLQEMFNPIVQLKSGGYIVIGITEALVAIDVNSGRATKERSIEETALKTNLEAATEIARQIKLRDLAGLIVIDFIDMEERRNNLSVEKKIKEHIILDRARIQIGRISIFGLLEMSRQRLRPGMLESTTTPCLFCHGSGITRSNESLALQIIRTLEKEGALVKESQNLVLYAPVEASNFLINNKREHIQDIETRFKIKILIEASVELISPNFKIIPELLEKNDKKIFETNNGKPRKKYKKIKKEHNDHKESNSVISEIPEDLKATNDNEDEQKKRKRRRRKKPVRDKVFDTETIESDKPTDSNSNNIDSIKNPRKKKLDTKKVEPIPLTNLKNSNLDNLIDSSRIIEIPSEKKSIEKNNSNTKKTRTKASVKKTIESLNKEQDNNLKVKAEKEPKMGKKGWWDREES